MKTEKVVSVRYIEAWENLSGYKHPKYKYKQVTTTCTKRYHNCLYLLAGLNSSCRDLMDFLCERMDKNNIVYSTEMFRNTFIEVIDKITESNVTYSHSAVKKAFNTLAKKQLILPRGRGSYQVNPEFFFRNSEKERIEAIKMILEFNNEDQ